MKKMNKITEPVLKKRFGQHLLTSSGVLDKILHAAAIERNDTVLVSCSSIDQRNSLTV